MSRNDKGIGRVGYGDRNNGRGVRGQTAASRSGGRLVSYDRRGLSDSEKELMRIRKLDAYVPKIPEPPFGAGAVYDQIQIMNEKVMKIYNQVDLLLKASQDALISINIEIDIADKTAAEQYKK